MKLLFISEVFPYPPTSGRRIPLYHTLRLLGREHDISLACFRQPNEQITPDMRQQVAQYCRIVGVSPMSALSPAAVVRNLIEPYPLSLGRYPWNSMAQAVKQTLADGQVDLVHAFGVNVAPFWRLAPGLSRVLAPNDCPHLVLDQMARHRRTPLYRRLHSALQARKMRRLEMDAFPRYHRVYVVTPEDRDALLQVDPELNVEVVPLGVEVAPTAAAVPAANMRRPALLFTGAMRSKVNVASSSFLCEQILPLVRREVPDVQLYMVGNDPPQRVRELATRHPGVTVTGYVEDLSSYLHTADVYVCPLLAASGIQNRVLEAMAAGKAIVCTPIVANRLEVTPGEHLLVADTPQEIAAHVVRLLRDASARERLGKAAQALVREKYTWESAAQRLNAIYQEAAATVPRQES